MTTGADLRAGWHHHIPGPPIRNDRGAALRIAWLVSTVLVVQGFVCAIALVPVVVLWSQLFALTSGSETLRVLAIGLALVPSYVLFAMLLMLSSALITRAAGWRTPPDAEMRIADVGWPLLRWVRGMVAVQIVRFFAGPLFRGSPVWTAYMRLAGARLGRRVYINSLSVNDYNLLDFADDVVIGEGVHLSGHTVERGVVKTGRVKLGRGVTVGLASVVEIDVEAGDGCQIGALSFVPKHMRLAAGATYIGAPAHRIGQDRRSKSPVAS